MSAARSRPNSLGRATLTLGDRWRMLIVREAFLGARRYRDWRQAIDISDPVLGSRLRALVDDGILARVASTEAAHGHEYVLTTAGTAMWKILLAVSQWDARWAEEHRSTFAVQHTGCGHESRPILACGACSALAITPADTQPVRHEGYVYEQASPPRYRRSPASVGHGDAIDLLGDRWSTSVLAAALFGTRRYVDFEREIGEIPSLILSRRLATFVEEQVLRRVPVVEGGRRQEYRLSPKGLDFFAIFAQTIAWSSAHLAGDGPPPVTLVHRVCGATLDPVYVCNVCRELLERRTIRVHRP